MWLDLVRSSITIDSLMIDGIDISRQAPLYISHVGCCFRNGSPGPHGAEAGARFSVWAALVFGGLVAADCLFRVGI